MKVVVVPVPVPVFIPVPLSMYSQHTPVPVTLPIPVRPTRSSKVPGPCLVGSFSLFFFFQLPVPLVVPPVVKDTQDAAVQSELWSASEEKAVQVPAAPPGGFWNAHACWAASTIDVVTTF